MANPQIQKSLRQSFEELPLKVRDWLTSERVTYYIVDMNKRLALEGEEIKVIPRLVLRLVVKDLEPKSFIPELAQELDLPPSATRTLTQEIEDKILKPVETSLRTEAGLDIKLIYLAEEAHTSPILSVLQEAAPLDQKPSIPVPPIPQSPRPVPPPIATFPPSAPPVSSPPRPYVPPPTPPIPPFDSAQGKPTPRPSPPPEKPLIQTEAAAHPQEQHAPPPLPKPTSEPSQEVKIPVTVKKSRVVWGEGK